MGLDMLYGGPGGQQEGAASSRTQRESHLPLPLCHPHLYVGCHHSWATAFSGLKEVGETSPASPCLRGASCFPFLPALGSQRKSQTLTLSLVTWDLE